MNKKNNDILVNFRLYRFQSVYIRMFVTFLCTSVLMVAIVGFFSWNISVNSISSKIAEKNIDMLNHVQRQIDDEIQKINLTAMNIVNHNFLVDDFNEQEIDIQFDITNSFFDQFYAEDYMKSFELYYTKSEIVVSSAAGYMPAKNNDMWAEVNGILNPINFSPIYLSNFGINNNSDNSFFVVTPFPRGMRKHGVLSIEISKDLFFKNVLQEGKNIMLLLDENNNLIFGDSKYYDKFIKEYNKKYQGKEIEESLEFGNSEFMALCKKSSVNDWKYINIQTIKDLNREPNYIRMITLLLMLICIIIGFIIWSKMSKNYYNPIVSIIKKAKSSLNLTDNPVKNEIEMIDDIFEQMIISNKEAGKLYELENNEIQKGILMSLCIGEMKDADYIEQQLNLINIPTDNSQYTIVSIVSEEMKQMSVDDIYEESAESIRQYIKMYADMYVGKNLKCISTYMNNNILIMLIVSSDSGSNIIKILKNMQKRINEEYLITTTIGVGKTYQKVTEIKKSYHQAVNALNYKFFAGKGSVIDIRDYSLSNIAHFNPYDGCEGEIMEMMKLGEREKLIEFFNRACSQIPSSMMMAEQISEALWQIVNYVMICTALRGYAYEDIYAKSYNSCYRTYKEIDYIGEKIYYIKNLLEMFFDYFDNVSPEKNIGEKQNDNIVDVIKEYIKTHLDGDLSINKISDVVFMTPTYISTIFKKNVGENFGDYVRTERINKAKELLCETKLDINDISSRVGYENTRSFMRIFKKYEGMTPSEYRKRIIFDKK